MADYVITITNGVRLFGNGPSTKWGDSNGYAYTMVWGTSKWGESSFSLVFNVEKLIENYVTPDTIIINETEKLIQNDLTLSEDLSSEMLRQGDWSYIFPPGVTENEDRIFTSFTCSSAQTVSYTCLAVGSTTWS